MAPSLVSSEALSRRGGVLTICVSQRPRRVRQAWFESSIDQRQARWSSAFHHAVRIPISPPGRITGEPRSASEGQMFARDSAAVGDRQSGDRRRLDPTQILARGHEPSLVVPHGDVGPLGERMGEHHRVGRRCGQRRTQVPSRRRRGCVSPRCSPSPIHLRPRSRYRRGKAPLCRSVCWVTCAGSSTDRASDYGSEGWGFESLPARSAILTPAVPFRLERPPHPDADRPRAYG